MPSGASTFGKLSEQVSVLKWKSNIHFSNKTSFLLELTLVYRLSFSKEEESNENLEILQSKMIAGKF